MENIMPNIDRRFALTLAVPSKAITEYLRVSNDHTPRTNTHHTYVVARVTTAARHSCRSIYAFLRVSPDRYGRWARTSTLL